MSYILDALKKAERERGIAQVPTLTTVHDDRAPAPNKRLWILSGICLACVVGIIWIGLFLLKPVLRPTRNDAAQAAPASPIPQKTNDSPSPQAVVPSITGSSIQTPPVSANDSAAAPSPTMVPMRKPAIEENHAAPVREIPPDSPATARRIPVPQRARPDDADNQAQEAPPQSSPESPQSKSVSLHESIAKMNLTILMYADAKSERIVFINDRKYLEGDYIEGRYLLESITPEGAVLSFQGERALLRPRAR